MTQPFSKPWVFILNMGMLPGTFFLSPFRPSLAELQILDEENHILFTVLDTLQTVNEVYRAKTSLGYVQGINVYAGALAKSLHKAFGNQPEPVWVIPRDEFENRVERGEFDVQVSTYEEQMKEAAFFSELLHTAYQRRTEDERRSFLLRLQTPPRRSTPTVYTNVLEKSGWCTQVREVPVPEVSIRRAVS